MSAAKRQQARAGRILINAIVPRRRLFDKLRPGSVPGRIKGGPVTLRLAIVVLTPMCCSR
jgi:hypothetical protein